MADDLFRQFYVRAARTLSIAHEVFRELKRDGRSCATTPITRLKLELGTWKADRDALADYRVAESEFAAANAVWKHAGQIGEEPEPPQLPASLPHPQDIDYLFTLLYALEFNIEQLEDTLSGNLSDASFHSDVSSLAKTLQSFGQALDWMKKRIEREKVPPHPKGQGEEDQFVTVDQMALLAGVGVGAMNNRLSRSRPDVHPIRPGGRKHNAYPWPGIRAWMLQHWPHRPLPEDFQALQEKLRELPPL